MLRLTGPLPIRRVELDLLGDGMAEQRIYADDLRDVAALYLRPLREGRFQLQVRITDAGGCADATGASRPVTVRP